MVDPSRLPFLPTVRPISRPLGRTPGSSVLTLVLALVVAAGTIAINGPALPVGAQVLGDPLTHEYFLPESEEEADRGYAKYVMLLVLEGIGEETVKPDSMPVLSRLVQEGAVTWSAFGVQPAQQLPTMTSLLTGLPADKHGITWNTFDFIRGYPRPPTVFDYLDLSGGKDSAVFFMDEAMYQLARPEPYIDYQVCGLLKPECNPATVVGHIQEFFQNVASGEGHGRAIAALPHLLVVHLPEARRIGAKAGWESKAYRQALGAVDEAIGAILDVYRKHKMLDRTAVFVTSLNLAGAAAGGVNGAVPRLPWIAWGAGIKHGYAIQQPVSILDTGATVMRTLGLETYTEWDSRAVDEIFTGPRPGVPAKQP